MSIVINEKIGSRTLQRSALSSPTGKREFIVYETDTTTDKPLTAMTALRSDGVPQVGDEHPDERRMTVISHDITADTASDYAQNIVCNYAVTGLSGGGTYTALSTGVRGVPKDILRNLPFVQPEYNSLGESLADIGGFSVDVAGKPVNVGVFVQTVDIRSPFANKPNFFIIRSLTNTRNASEWGGFNRGILLYLGCSASVTNGNMWTTTHNFAADELFHARQAPKRDDDSKVIMNVDGQAKDVRWLQPYPKLENFNALGLGNIP
jgi:hypothetical protein